MVSAHSDIKQKLEAALIDLTKLDTEIRTMREDGDESEFLFIEYLGNQFDDIGFSVEGPQS